MLIEKFCITERLEVFYLLQVFSRRRIGVFLSKEHILGENMYLIATIVHLYICTHIYARVHLPTYRINSRGNLQDGELSIDSCVSV